MVDRRARMLLDPLFFYSVHLFRIDTILVLGETSLSTFRFIYFQGSLNLSVWFHDLALLCACACCVLECRRLALQTCRSLSCSSWAAVTLDLVSTFCEICSSGFLLCRPPMS